MNTLKLTAVAAALAAAQSTSAYAANEGDGPWTVSGRNSNKNVNNPALRFGNDGQSAIPGNGAGSANGNSVGGSGGRVAPNGQ